MEMTQIRYFLALCKEGNFTRAARRCGVAQPSLTRAIRNLEQELGEPLFERRRQGTKLTAFGDQILPYFETICRCVAEAKRKPRRIFASNRETAIMQREEQIEEETIFAFTVSDEALEQATNSNFSLGNCTDARVCPVPA